MIYITHNIRDISKILNHPRVYKHIIDDSCFLDYTPNKEDFYMINDDKTGLVKLDQLNGTCCIAHIATLPELWGKAAQFVKDAIDWGFNNTTYSKVIALVPEFNRLTFRLCLKCGFEIEGKIKKSFLKNWKFHDQIVFGLTKTDFYKGEQSCQ